MNLLNKNKVLILVSSVLALVLSACSGNKEDANANKPVAAQKQAMKSSIDRLVQWPEKDLRARARKAVMEQHWYKPPGNSAFEYYLALKIKLNAPDESVDTALTDIIPYAVIGMDQAIAVFDDKEALRLEALIRLADPNAPALLRVKSDLEKMKARQAAASATEETDAKLKAEQAAKALTEAARVKAEAAKKLLEPAVKPAVQAPAPVVQAPEPVVQAPVQRAPEPPPPAPVAKAAITPISTPQPSYPREALSTGTTGEVVAEISISGTGEVTNVRIVSSSPRNVFDKAVISTVRRWKYKGNGENATIRRTFVFN